MTALALVKTDIEAMFLAGRKSTTLRAYAGDLEAFRLWGGNIHGLVGGNAAAGNAVAWSWRSSMVDSGLAPATVNRRMAALRSLVRLARIVGLCAWELDVQNVPAESYRDTSGPGLDAVRSMLGVAGPRDAAILHLLVGLGLRRAELVELDVEHLDLGRMRVSVLGKGRGDREWMTLAKTTAASVAAYVGDRTTGPLFLSHQSGARLPADSVPDVLDALCKLAGVTAKVRPHGLRHTAITAALEATRGDVRKVQKFSRHKDLKTVMRYDDNRLDFQGEVASLVAGAL